jgi:hypothetical protein
LIKKIEIKFPAINFFTILGHQILDPDPESGSAIRKNAGSGSETLVKMNTYWDNLYDVTGTG